MHFRKKASESTPPGVPASPSATPEDIKNAENPGKSAFVPASFKKIAPWLALFGVAVVFVAIVYCGLTGEMTGRSPLYFAVRFLICAGVFTVLFAWVSAFPAWLRVVFLTLFFLPCAFFAYVQCVFRLSCSYELVANIVETNAQEALSFVGFSSVSALLFYVLAMAFLGVFLGKIRPAFPSRKKILIFAPIFLVAVNCVGIVFVSFIPVYRMAGFVSMVKGFSETEGAMMKEFKRLEKEVAVAPEKIRENSPVVVLHIGESVRADHASFNGYARETFPRVHEEFRRGNVVSFPKCVSFSTDTRLSFVGILTPAKVLNTAVPAGTFIPFLNAAGTTTGGFFTSMPAGGTFYDSTIVCLVSQLQQTEFTRAKADRIFGKVSAALGNVSRNAFFLYYGEGAHVPANVYNVEKYSVFVPAATDFAENETRKNAYDNCPVATDDFIGNAIEALKDKDAVYVYVADHGDMLGEDGYWARNPRCYRRPESRHVLFFVWASKKFQTEHAGLWEILKKNRERLGVVSHDFLYHSILTLCGIRNEFYDATNGLFSEKAVAFPTEMPAAESFGVLHFANSTFEWTAENTQRHAEEAEKRLRSRDARQKKSASEF